MITWPTSGGYQLKTMAVMSLFEQQFIDNRNKFHFIWKRCGLILSPISAGKKQAMNTGARDPLFRTPSKNYGHQYFDIIIIKLDVSAPLPNRERDKKGMQEEEKSFISSWKVMAPRKRATVIPIINLLVVQSSLWCAKRLQRPPLLFQPLPPPAWVLHRIAGQAGGSSRMY